MTTIEKRVKRIVAQQLGLKEELILNESSFCDDLDGDSLDAVELTLALEEEFELEITDSEAERLTTVQSAIDYITAHAKA